MARRKGRRTIRRDLPGADRPFNIGTHWRADGAPKTAYGSQHEALSVADERRQDSGVVLSVYRCEFCSAWHMGNAGGREP
jgi:hypothetical protein